MSKPLVSIIVPIYNTEKYLQECLDSIINQSLQEIEILCIDDGSTDKCGNILDEYAKKDKRVVVIHKENEGLVTTRKHGVMHARADYIGFVDSDDWIEPDMFETMYNHMADYDLDFVSTGVITNEVNYDYVEKKCYLEENEREELFSKMIYDFEEKKNGVIPNVVSKLYKKEILLTTCKDIDSRIRFHEDDCLVYSYMVACKRLGIMDEAFYHYRYVEGSMSKGRDEFFFGRLNLYYFFLYQQFCKTRYKDILLPQLDMCMTKAVLLGINSSFGLNLCAHYVGCFPFEDMHFVHCEGKRKIVVYGAGSWGHKIVQCINADESKAVVAVIDRNINLPAVYGHKVECISYLKEIDYDDVIIAIENYEIAMEVYEMLLEYGVRNSVIHFANGKINFRS